MASPTSVADRTPIGLILVCGCVIALVTFGVRASFGLFTNPLSATHGWDRDVFALAAAIQNLCWGIAVPLAGVVIDRFGPAWVLTGGAILYALGTGLMAISDTPLALHMTAGIMVGIGMGGASQFTVLAAFQRLLPPERRPWALGLGTAAGSMGQFVFAPIGQGFILAYGWQTAAVLLALFLGLVPLLAVALRGGRGGAVPMLEGAHMSLRRALKLAFGHRSYTLLVAGFFVCGFQLAFITIHMPPYLSDVGADPRLAAWAIAMIGLFNVVGAYMAGGLSGRLPKAPMLSVIYLLRGLAIAVFIMVPVTTAGVLLFGAFMGLLWLSTVPPTSGLVAVMFGTRYIATLFGIVFFSHQVGSFLGAWLGGLLFTQTGSYMVVWWMCVALGLAAALVHLPIVERRAEAFAG